MHTAMGQSQKGVTTHKSFIEDMIVKLKGTVMENSVQRLEQLLFFTSYAVTLDPTYLSIFVVPFSWRLIWHLKRVL